MRSLYDLTVRHKGHDLQVINTHLDLDVDDVEVKLRDLPLDACRRNGDPARLVGDYALVVRAHGNPYEDLLVYVTTAVS